jgi:peptidoglycan L-alanyl-D-glutamate endopeptidase CwlK
MSLDAVSQERLVELHPLLADRVRRLAEALSAEEIDIRVTQGLRSWSAQDALFAQGRNTPGAIITKAPGGYSWHNFGLAADVAVMLNGVPDWDVAHPQWQRIVDGCPGLGLRSGATFSSIVDYPHVQPEELPESPTAEDRQIFIDGGVDAIWTKYFPPIAISA